MPKPEPMDIDPSVSRMYRRDFKAKPQQNCGFRYQNVGTQMASTSAQANKGQQNRGFSNQNLRQITNNINTQTLNAQGVKRPRGSNDSFRPQEKT